MARGAKRRPAEVYSLPAPTRGLILNEPLAASRPGGARVLENFFPLATSLRTRGGALRYATIGTSPVERLWTFKSGSVEKFFASDSAHIYEITTVVDADTPPTPDVTGQTSGYYSTAQFGTAGGDYLYAVNGTDLARLYNGSSWTAINGSSTPAITGVTTSDLSFVWSFASRLWFVKKNSMSAFYLPVDSIGGAATEFSLAGIFQEGGSLVMGGKWSLDAGNGLDDKCLFISSEGEVAVYQGADPNSATDWLKVGVYRIAPVKGINANISAGGDFLVATEEGIIPISMAVNKDVAALSLSAVSAAIEPEWKKKNLERTNIPWEMMKWPSKNMMVVSVPATEATQQLLCFVANIQTGAWTFYTGWDARCIGLWADSGYFGTSDGKILQMETGGSDDGMPYTCVYVGLPDSVKSPAAYKTFHSARATFQANLPFLPKISASMNYKINLPTAPNSAAVETTSLWDVGLWDQATWDYGNTQDVSTKWVSIGKSGFSISPQVQMTFGISLTPNVELIQIDLLFDRGAVMV